MQNLRIQLHKLVKEWKHQQVVGTHTMSHVWSDYDKAWFALSDVQTWIRDCADGLNSVEYWHRIMLISNDLYYHVKHPNDGMHAGFEKKAGEKI